SAQYFATALFAPLMGWIVFSFGWEHVFVVMGVLGILFSIIWLKTIYNPRQHPRISPAELEHIEQNGGLVDMDHKRGNDGPKWGYIKQLLTSRMLLGVYLGQYCINAITYFFLTWFPVYLVQERGMTILKAGFIASLPAICGFIGGVLGGVISDWLLRRGHSLTFSRKLPIVCGLMLSTTMVFCNYVDAEWMVVGFMTLAFFGKGIGALGWAVVADTSPKQIAGLSGGLFNTFGNIASITTPIVIGYIISATGSFKWALVYVGANALVAVLSYLVIVGPIKRIELREESPESKPASVPDAQLASPRH
ncbi:MAG TPA: MFS transporter, partial [Pseudomonas sp.]|nr:MFS transporter [Pseudomonas sp.]